MATFAYRVIRRSTNELAIHEVYFGEDGKIDGFTLDAFSPVLPTVEDLRFELGRIMAALDLPILEGMTVELAGET
jgi:hypothetical protein